MYNGKNIELITKTVSDDGAINYGKGIEFTEKTRFNSEKNWNGR